MTTLTLATQAISVAVADAGLSMRDVDGVACHRVGDSVEPSIVARSLGIRDVRFICDIFGGGSSAIGVIGAAANAIVSGQASCVICWRALNARSGFRMGGAGPGLLFGDGSHWLPYRHVTPPQQFAMVTRAYMHARGLTSEDLGRIAITQREHARLNPRAMMTNPLTMDEYLSSRWIAEPLRLYDCCLETDAAVALVVTSADRARDLAQWPVTVAAVGFGGGMALTSNFDIEIWSSGASTMAPRLFAAAGVGPDEVDFAELYDAFTPLVLMQLEDYGFCEPGAAAEMVRIGDIRLGRRLPVNTHGGHLSEGYVHGLNHVAEAVNQLRGNCGGRQVAGAQVALATGNPGVVSGLTCAAVLKRG